MNWFSVISVFLLVVACADAGWITMTADKEPTHLKGCLKLDNAQPVVSCRANFVVKKKEDKLAFSIGSSCTLFKLFIDSQEYQVFAADLKNATVSRTVSVLNNGETEGILYAVPPSSRPSPLVFDDGHIALKFEQIDCEVRLVNLVPVVSDVVQKGGLSETAKIGIGTGCAGFLIVIIGLLAWKYLTWRMKQAEEKKAKDGAKVEPEKKPHSPKETLRIRDDFKKEEKQQSIEQKPSVESDQKSVASPSKEAAAAVKPKKRDETAVKPKTEEVVTQKTQEVAVPDKPVSVVCGVVAAKKPREPKKKGNKKKNAAVKTAVEKTTHVDADKKVVQVKALAEKVTVAETKAKEVEAVNAVVDNKNMVEVASKEPLVQDTRPKEVEVKDKGEVANKQLPVQQQAVKQVDVKTHPVVEDIKIVVVEQDKKARTRSADDDGYKTELELVYDEGVFTEEHKRKEPGPLSVETETQPEIKRSDDAVELNVKRPRLATTSNPCLPAPRQKKAKKVRSVPAPAGGEKMTDREKEAGRIFTELHRMKPKKPREVEVEVVQRRRRKADSSNEVVEEVVRPKKAPVVAARRERRQQRRSRKAKKRTDDEAAVEEKVTPADRARAERRRRFGGEEPPADVKEAGCCPSKKEKPPPPPKTPTFGPTTTVTMTEFPENETQDDN